MAAPLKTPAKSEEEEEPLLSSPSILHHETDEHKTVTDSVTRRRLAYGMSVCGLFVFVGSICDLVSIFGYSKKDEWPRAADAFEVFGFIVVFLLNAARLFRAEIPYGVVLFQMGMFSRNSFLSGLSSARLSLLRKSCVRVGLSVSFG